MVCVLPEGLSESQQARFKALQQRFVAGLPLRWAEIAGAPDALARQSALHRLAGSAGGYGFERLDQCARAADAQSRFGAGAALAPALALLEAEISRVMHDGNGNGGSAAAEAPGSSQSGDNCAAALRSNAGIASPGPAAQGNHDGTARKN